MLFTKFDGFITKLLQYIEKHSIKFGIQETLVLQELKIPSKLGKLFIIMSLYIITIIRIINLFVFNICLGNDILAALRLIPFLFQPVTLKLDKKRKKL